MWECVCVLSCVWFFAVPWTVACQAPASMDFCGFPRQEYWSGLPFPPPGDLPDPGIKPGSPVSPAVAGRFPYHQCHLGSPSCADLVPQICKMLPWSRVGNSKKHTETLRILSHNCVWFYSFLKIKNSIFKKHWQPVLQ